MRNSENGRVMVHSLIVPQSYDNTCILGMLIYHPNMDVLYSFMQFNLVKKYPTDADIWFVHKSSTLWKQETESVLFFCIGEIDVNTLLRRGLTYKSTVV